MAGNPFDQFDAAPIAGTAPPPAGNPFDRFDAYAGLGDVVQAAPPGFTPDDPYASLGDVIQAAPPPLPSEQFRAQLHQLLADPKSTDDQIKTFVVAQHRSAAPGTSLDTALNWRTQNPGRGGEIGVIDNGVVDGSTGTMASRPQAVPAHVALAPPDNPFFGALRSAADGFVANAVEPVGAVLDAVIPGVGKLDSPDMKSIWDGTSFSDAYHNNLAINPAQVQADTQARPGLTEAANLTGALLSPINKIGAPVESAGVVANLLRAGAGAATYGGIQGASDSNASNLLGVAKDAAVKSGEYGAGGLALGGIISAPSIVRSATATERVLSPEMQAFERQGVPALPADVGGTATKMITAGAKSSLGGPFVHNAAEASVSGARGVRDRVAGLIGNVADSTDVAGQAIKRGAQAFLGRTRSIADRLCDAIPITPNRPVVLANTQQQLANLTRGLESNPELSRAIADSKLQQFADAIQGKTNEVPTGLLDASGQPVTRQVQQGGELSWQDLNAFRSYIGERAGAPALQYDTSQAALKSLYGALSEDMRATAADAGPDASAAFTRANNYYRAREARIDSIVTPILGRNLDNSDESAFRAIQNWSGDRGSFAKTAQALRTLPNEEANTVRATIFNRLGASSPGAQNPEGDAFSPSTFLTHWNKLPEKTRSVLFPGAQYQKDISDLVKITGAQKAAQKYNNVSGTAAAVNVTNLLGHLTRLFTSPHEVIGSLTGQFALGKLMASPQFARWLGSTPADGTAAAAQLAHVNQLTQIAAQEPAIASNVIYLKDRLVQALNQSPHPLAAQDNRQNASATSNSR